MVFLNTTMRFCWNLSCLCIAFCFVHHSSCFAWCYLQYYVDHSRYTHDRLDFLSLWVPLITHFWMLGLAVQHLASCILAFCIACCCLLPFACFACLLLLLLASCFLTSLFFLLLEVILVSVLVRAGCVSCQLCCTSVVYIYIWNWNWNKSGSSNFEWRATSYQYQPPANLS